MSRAAATESSYTGARPDVLALVPEEAERILDIGCSDGSLGGVLRERGAEVWGIEFASDYAAAAESKLDRVICGDAGESVRKLISEGVTFDAVVCADILEHLVDPASVLECARTILKPEGACIVSLPNVRFYSTLTGLAFHGSWPRKDRGVHDRTHLQWFTDRDARSMFADAGFRVELTVSNYRLADRPDRRINRFATAVSKLPGREFFAYQHLYRLRPI